MVWKRIMNKRQSSENVYEDKKGKTSEESVQGKEKLQAFLTEMVMEWNLRLFLETENNVETDENEIFAFYPQSVLWVEEVTVTSYDACPDRKVRCGLIRNRKQGLAGHIKSFLMGVRNFSILKK